MKVLELLLLSGILSITWASQQPDPIIWNYGMEPAERCVSPGSSVTFSWSGSFHNVLEVESQEQLASCTGITSREGWAGPWVWKAPAIPGTHSFLCGVGAHCRAGGMKATVRVSYDCSSLPYYGLQNKDLWIERADCTLEEEIEYLFNDLPGHQGTFVHDFQECAKLCFEADGCEFWTFRSRRCFLKTSSEGKDQSVGGLSGQKACGVGTNTNCQDDNKDCKSWSLEGLCKHIHKICKKSCGKCSANECPVPVPPQPSCRPSSPCTPLALCPVSTSSPTSCSLPSGGPGVCCSATRDQLPFKSPVQPIAIPCSPADHSQPPPCSRQWRSLDGRCNNFWSPNQGSSGEPFIRLLPHHYGPRGSLRVARGGSPLPSARAVSVSLMSGDLGGGRSSGLSEHMMQWGQFLAHDLMNTPRASMDCCGRDRDNRACAPFSVARDDPVYGPRGVSCLPFDRSTLACGKEQQNKATAYLDCSQMYGPNGETARTHFHGLLKDEALEIELEAMAPDSGPPCNTKVDKHCFISGDDRINMTPGLAMTHAVWHREHNRLARQLAKIQPSWNDERLFQETRSIVVALAQHITYSEYLPILLGQAVASSISSPSSLPYNPAVSAAVSTEFASAAFRFGHSMVNNDVSLFTTRCPRKKVESKELQSNLFNPDLLHTPGNINELVAGQASTPSRSPGPHLVEAIRGNLFSNDGGAKETHGGQDLASRNIQRGRDHGVPGYAAYFSLCTGTTVSAFSHLSDLSDLSQAALARTYRHVEDVDLWVGGLLEIPVAGALVGPTFSCILAEQFGRTRQGDRFFYLRQDGAGGLTPAQLKAVRRFSLARLLCDNSKIAFLQPMAFRLASDSNPLVRCSSEAIPTLDLNPWA